MHNGKEILTVLHQCNVKRAHVMVVNNHNEKAQIKIFADLKLRPHKNKHKSIKAFFQTVIKTYIHHGKCGNALTTCLCTQEISPFGVLSQKTISLEIINKKAIYSIVSL